MPSPDSESPDETFFNDLSQQPPESNTTNAQEIQQDSASRAKRIACVLCRKRKLRCDGARPTCSTCKRLSHDCAYDEVRKRSGPKRGYVKLLEQRLEQVETLLKSQDAADSTKDTTRANAASAYVASTLNNATPSPGEISIPTGNSQTGARRPSGLGADPFRNAGANGSNAKPENSWEMIGLGLEEPLPPQEVMDDLYHIYFTKIHLTMPIIHRPRFLAALNLAPHMRPPVCLRYIMWTLAASVTDKYDELQEHFYQRSRKYAQMDEMRGHGETTMNLAHCQTWILTGTYEFKQMYFPRAWLSVGRAVRFAQMFQLHRLDGFSLDVKQCLPPPKDWTEREERRRTFWMAFCIDRYASIGTGWPMTIDERDIKTNLPASEEAFEKSKEMSTGSLDQVLDHNGEADLQSLGGTVFTAAMFGRNLLHLHRPAPDDNDGDINGGYWNRHRHIEQILLQTSLGLPDHLRLPYGLTDPNVVFANMCIHTSAICLHQAAIFKADKHHLPASVGNESKIRCLTAAAEIASIMRMISHMDLGAMNPFISFCVYVAARVFAQYLKTRPNDQQIKSSLRFLLQAMQALRRKNPLTESFLAQLDVDLETAGIQGLQQKQYLSPKDQLSQVPASIQDMTESIGCHFQGPGQMLASYEASTDQQEKPNATACTNTFGNSNPRTQPPLTSTQYASTAPGPPYHVHNINSINMSVQNTAYLSAQVPPNTVFGRTESQDFMSPQVAFRDRSDIDFSGGTDHTSSATLSSKSRGSSTSQSPYSPGQPYEHNVPYRASPKLAYSVSASGAATGFAGFASTNEALIVNNSNPLGNMDNNAYDDSFMMGNEWDYTGLNVGTGLTPMVDTSWDAALESVTMGWESVGPSQDEQAQASVVR
ncbi:Binuclear zinc transcription factor [Pyrenophora tritici-repentis]|nr:Binuclear zinc transcription factor [Pyrenophora tritici-repentis]KAI0615104.1 Binuclear zinc transcription factor [Pyrenophora tritici-repentis]KAI0627407.1 Binuclear zinc transcription factor [Pyrenophora tritici-repentis]